MNTKGELVGINTAIFSQTGGYQGVGFAVPTSMGQPVYESLVKHGKVVRGYLGIGIQDLNQDLAKSFGVTNGKGALVSDVRKTAQPIKQGSTRRCHRRPIKAHRWKMPVALQRLGDQNHRRYQGADEDPARRP